MAGKRIAASAIDWVKFAELVPEGQKVQFLAFKAKSDNFLRKALALPENAPAINWAHYRSQIKVAGVVDKFEKEYQAFKIPYPKENVMSQIDAQAKEVEVTVANFTKDSLARIAAYKAELEIMNNMVPIEHMTMDDIKDTFPDQAYDPVNRPTFWPHDLPEEEPQEDPHASH